MGLEHRPQDKKNIYAYSILAIAFAGLYFAQPSSTETHTTPNHPSSLATPTPLNLPLQEKTEILQTIITARATEIAESNSSTNFREKNEFTKEIFEQVKKSTYAIIVYKSKGRSSIGTTWLAKKDGPTLYLVTNKHLFGDEGEQPMLEDATFWRPSQDSEKIHAKAKIAALHPTLDLAVLKVSGISAPSDTHNPLEWVENAQLTPGESLLAIGYPMAFQNPKDDMDYSTYATYLKLLHATPDRWKSEGLITTGNSGSPVIKIIEGIPRVVGVLFANNADIHSINGNYQVKPFAFFSPLNINPLIQTLQHTRP